MTDAFFRATLWAQRELHPREPVPLFDGELALDRDFLGNKDGSLSRAANAPRLLVDGRTLRLADNPRSAKRPLVFPGMRFIALQDMTDEPSGSGGVEWTVRPASLGVPERLVTSPRGSVALLTVFTPEPESGGVTHCLRTLPPVLSPEPGDSLALEPPALIVVGDSVLEIVSEETGVPPPPPSVDRLAPKAHALDLSSFHERLETLEALDGFEGAGASPSAMYRLPGAAAAESFEAAERTAARLLSAIGKPWAFVPVIQDERLPRLALAALTDLRPDASAPARLFVSGADPEAWIQALRAHLSRAPVQPSVRASQPPPSAGAVPPASLAPLASLATFGELETANPGFARIVDQLGALSSSEVTIVLLGESGTGKEFVAREIHRHSPRAASPFVAVNCAALSPNLIASELFGHVRGAFTSAHEARPGAFVAAEGGTLFLDEIGDAPLEVQLSLLRALETRRIRAVGSDRERAVNVRVLAATSRSLGDLVQTGAFRTDLYYRLAECVVTLPALRERREDLPALARALLAALDAEASLTDSALRALSAEALPGNVRELRNILKRALALSGGARPLSATDLGLDTQARESARPTKTPASSAGISFPRDIVALSEEIWRAGHVVEPVAENRYEAQGANPRGAHSIADAVSAGSVAGDPGRAVPAFVRSALGDFGERQGRAGGAQGDGVRREESGGLGVGGGGGGVEQTGISRSVRNEDGSHGGS